MIESPGKSSKPKISGSTNDEVIMQRPNSLSQRKSTLEDRNSRRLTKIERSFALQSKELNEKLLKRSSLKYLPASIDGTIPVNGFYRFLDPNARLKAMMIHDFKMNSLVTTSDEIPVQCFQKEEIKNLKSRRSQLNRFFRTQEILNSAAFKGYFCDLLMDKLYEPMSLDSDAVDESSVLEEFIIVNQKEVQYCIAPMIRIKDWNNYVQINKNFRRTEKTELTWPSYYMQKIMNILPCSAVPSGYSPFSEENFFYEKTWRLVFPKTEEFLLLHMMHAHIRCYFFVLLIYKSFIESEINSTSFGPKHLMHLLFWRVQKNFLGWPDDRPGETLINFLKVLYRKLQSKTLWDFFIPTRNLFDSSLPKDLHMAQTLVKKIIENPVLHIIRAIRNLHFESNFYPDFDVLKLNKLLTPEKEPKEAKKPRKENNKKKVHFQDDEQRWKKVAIKQVQLERKAEEEEQASRVSIDSINFNETTFSSQDVEKCNQILEMFFTHFTEMAGKSLEYKFLSQAFFYLYQAQKLFKLLSVRERNQNSLKFKQIKLNKLKENCYGELKKDLGKPLQKNLTKRTKKIEVEQNNFLQKQNSFKEAEIKPEIHQKDKKTAGPDEEEEVFTIKL